MRKELETQATEITTLQESQEKSTEGAKMVSSYLTYLTRGSVQLTEIFQGAYVFLYYQRDTEGCL